mmetsp:Transcript_46870/g.117303  ORF Transcript_46870/g.117303 Transcript_46870/m.117303 type:complete len:396 (-) Transcript_46870:8-1195(-)
MARETRRPPQALAGTPRAYASDRFRSASFWAAGGSWQLVHLDVPAARGPQLPRHEDVLHHLLGRARRGGLQLRHLAVVQGPAQRAQVGLRLGQVLGAGDGDGALGHAPVDRHLAHRLAALLADRLHCVVQWVQAWDDAPEDRAARAGRQRLAAALAVAAGQHAQRQRAVRNHLQPQVRARRGRARRLRRLAQQRILYLHAHQRHLVLLQEPRDLGQLLGPVVADAHRAHEARLVHVHQPAPHRPLLEGLVVGGRPVQLPDVHRRPPEPLRRRPGSLHHRAAGDSPGVRRKFAGDDRLKLGLPRVFRHELAQQLLALPVERAGAVRVRRVEQVDTRADAQVVHLLKLLVHLLVVAPQQLVAPGPGSQPHGRNRQRAQLNKVLTPHLPHLALRRHRH